MLDCAFVTEPEIISFVSDFVLIVECNENENSKYLNIVKRC